MDFTFAALWRKAEEACDAGIDAISSIASSSSTPLFAAAAEAARDALAPLRQPLAEGGWPRGHGVEIQGIRYTVERLLGEGGFACVYAVKREGEGDKKNKLFALKRIVASSRECLEGARREVAAARAAAAAASPPPRLVGLLPLLASEEKRTKKRQGENTTEVLLLFPFCGGGSLADAVGARGKEKEAEILSVAPLLRLFAQVAEGLSRLHGGDSKLGHFDVKPHNIFLSREGRGDEEREGEGGKAREENTSSSSSAAPRALLGDWGSARKVPARFSAHAEALALCEEAERSTTAAFRPPELWDPLSFAAGAESCSSTKEEEGGDGSNRKRKKEISGKADVWSLGASLFACLGDGRSPSEVAAGRGGGGGSLALAACSGRVEWPPCSLPAPPSPFPSSSSSSSSCPPSSSSSSSRFVPSSAVKALVERCLSLEPDKRPSAAEFAAEAMALAEGIERARKR